MSFVAKGTKFASFDLRTMEGFTAFFEEEFGVGRIGVTSLPSSTTHGVKYQIDLS
jgi:hypothetical protein